MQNQQNQQLNSPLHWAVSQTWTRCQNYNFSPLINHKLRSHTLSLSNSCCAIWDLFITKCHIIVPIFFSCVNSLCLNQQYVRGEMPRKGEGKGHKHDDSPTPFNEHLISLMCLQLHTLNQLAVLKYANRDERWSIYWHAAICARSKKPHQTTQTAGDGR